MSFDKSVEEISKCLEKDVAATISVPNFNSFYHSILRCGIFEVPKFKKNFGVISDRVDEFRLGVERLADFCNEIQQLHLVLWKGTDKTEFVLILKLFDSSEVFKEDLEFVTRFVFSPDKRLDELKEKKEFIPILENKTTDLIQNITVRRVGNSLFLSNSQSRLETTAANIVADNVPVGSRLIDDRRFQIAMKEFQKHRDASLFAFARPKHFKELFTERRGVRILEKPEKLEELVSSGMTVGFSNSNLALHATYFVKNTYPPTGIAKVWNSYDSIPDEWPSFCFNVRGIEARAWRPRPDGLVEDSKTKVDSGTNSRCFIWYENHIGSRRGMLLYRVSNYDFAKKYLQHLTIQDPNVKKVDETIRSDNDVLVYCRKPKSIEREAKRLREYRKSDRKELANLYDRELEKTGLELKQLVKNYVPDLVEYRGWVLTKDWLFQGQIPDIRRVIDAINGFESDVELLAVCEFDEKLALAKKLGFASEISEISMAKSGLPGKSSAAKYFISLLANKYPTNKKLVRSIVSGNSFKNLEQGKEFQGDAFDLAGYLIVETIQESFEITQIRSKMHEGKLKAALGIFSKFEN